MTDVKIQDLTPGTITNAAILQNGVSASEGFAVAFENAFRHEMNVMYNTGAYNERQYYSTSGDYSPGPASFP